MKTRHLVGLTLAVLLTCGAVAEERAEPFPPAKGNADADATVVVYNEKDDESRDLARFYMEQRRIPKGNLIALNTAISEDISRDDYERSIAEPIRRAFTSNFWWKLREPDSPLGPVESNKIRYLAVIRGVPVRINGAIGYPGDKIFGEPPLGTRSDAAVDSELAALGMFNRAISGALNNPYYRSFTPIADFRHPELMLVCRLDGPSAGTVRRMITDSIASEREGLTGFAYVDARGLPDGPYKEGDDWMNAIATTARRRGIPTIFDNGPEVFPESYPMRQAALYYGWYMENVTGPFTRPGFKLARGSIAIHIHSFSAITIRDPQKAWVAPLLYSGAAATLGNVFEPYLTLTVHLDVFHDRISAGFSFAEAAYMAQRVLSWQTTCVGDPLYRPYADASFGEAKPRDGEWAEYRRGARLWFDKTPAAGAEALDASARKLRSGVIYEGLGLLQLTRNDPTAAITAFQQARQLYKNPEDAARAGIHEIIQLRAAKRTDEALTLTRKLIAANPRASFLPLLRTFDPPPATPVPATPAPTTPAKTP